MGKALGQAYFTDALLQLREIGHCVVGFEALIVLDKPLDDVLLQPLGDPEAELSSLVRLDPVTDRE